jgi:hypothetical protein
MKGRHVRVGEVVHNLPHGPSTLSISHVELRFVERANGIAKLLRHL